MYYARTTKSQTKDDWQLLNDHLNSVAELARLKAFAFNGQDYAYIAGLLHDIGKYSGEFQSRLEGDLKCVDHSTAGAQLAVSKYGSLHGKIMAYAIAGHHTGIPNGLDATLSSLTYRLSNSSIPYYGNYKDEIISFPSLSQTPIFDSDNKIPSYLLFQIGSFIRMIFSCLVDADYTDSEAFASELSNQHNTFTNFSEFFSILSDRVTQLSHNNSLVNQIRSQVLKESLKKSVGPKGLYTLTVPTGGGKTLSSMAFGLKHLMKHNLERIIYVIPYTSIIEQTAGQFKNLFGADQVLEHHSNFTVMSEHLPPDVMYRLMKASENWDIPIIITTNVQFFESYFSNRPSKCRKLHNMSNSVIIIDEAQMIQTSLLTPIVSLLADLVSNYNSSIVLCTATQPVLNPYFPATIKSTEIISDPNQLYNNLKRVDVSFAGKMSDSELVEELLVIDKVLCIVNTRQHAYDLYKMLGRSPGHYHLSAKMCAKHRSQVLEEIKVRLNNTAEPCKIISTQLIEAGVDIDLPVVMRAIAGLDSIAQAAGRCNREGKLDKGKVFIFEPERGLPKGWMSTTAAYTREALRRYDDPLSLEAINEYFTRLYHMERYNHDQMGIMKLYKQGERTLNIPFEDIAEAFKVIENKMVSLIIPYDEASVKLIKSLYDGIYTKSTVRQLQPYTVQIYEKEMTYLINLGVVDKVDETYYVLKDMSYYDMEYGLITKKG